MGKLEGLVKNIILIHFLQLTTIGLRKDLRGNLRNSWGTTIWRLCYNFSMSKNLLLIERFKGPREFLLLSIFCGCFNIQVSDNVIMSLKIDYINSVFLFSKVISTYSVCWKCTIKIKGYANNNDSNSTPRLWEMGTELTFVRNFQYWVLVL